MSFTVLVFLHVYKILIEMGNEAFVFADCTEDIGRAYGVGVWILPDECSNQENHEGNQDHGHWRGECPVVLLRW
jgi:hypothetical protein